jgi:hypothetical protein
MGATAMTWLVCYGAAAAAGQARQAAGPADECANTPSVQSNQARSLPTARPAPASRSRWRGATTPPTCGASSPRRSTTYSTPSRERVSADRLLDPLNDLLSSSRPAVEQHSNYCSSVLKQATYHARPAGGAKEFLVRASYLEIYNEDIRDLLSKSPEAKLDLKESPDR